MRLQWRAARIDLEDVPALRNDHCEVVEYGGRSRIGSWAKQVRNSAVSRPGAAAVATITLVGAGLVCFALRPVLVPTTDTQGPLLAHCGLSYYLFGNPDPAVRRACTAGFAGHATILFITLPVVTAGLVLLSVAHRFVYVPERASTGHGWRAVVATPARAAAAAFALCGTLVGLAAMRTVPVSATAPSGPVVIHCGVGYADIGASVAGVHAVCRRAFEVHNDFLLAGCFMALVGAVALGSLPRSKRRSSHGLAAKVAGDPQFATLAPMGAHFSGGQSE